MAWSRGNARWCSAHFLLWIHPGLCCPHSEWGFPLQLNFLESPSRHSHCWVSMVILNIIKLASSCHYFPPTGRLYTLNWEPVCTLHQVASQQAFGHINEKGNQTGESVSPTSANHIFFCKQSTYKSILHNSQMFQLLSLTDIIHPRLTDHTHVSHTQHTRLTHSLLNTDCSSSSERRVTIHVSLFLLSFICGSTNPSFPSSLGHLKNQPRHTLFSADAVKHISCPVLSLKVMGVQHLKWACCSEPGSKLIRIFALGNMDSWLSVFLNLRRLLFIRSFWSAAQQCPCKWLHRKARLVDRWRQNASKFPWV